MQGINLEIVPRDQHRVSRANISPNALRVMSRLNDAGYQGYLVGGAVRDLQLGGHPKDFDVATDATPEQLKSLFRNCRLIGRRFRLAHVHFGPEIVEVATFRGHSDGDDRTSVNGLLVRDNIYGTLEEDALRRDFTVNALYYGTNDFAIHDFAGGFSDLNAGVLRLIGEPEQRYTEDPVRMLRAARFAAKLNFTLAEDTEAPIARLSHLLEETAPARLFDECLKLFLAGNGRASWEWLERLSLAGVLFPDTVRALKADADGRARAMLMAALDSTDNRVRNGRPVTPAFLFAALLWEPYRQRVIGQVQSGIAPAVAEEQSGDVITQRQVSRVALPKRFSLPMREIWLLQSRFDEHSRRRVMRFLSHPRFRASYDFLELRCHQSPELKPVFDWWTSVQSGQDVVPARETAQARRKRPNRRRKQRTAASH